MDDPLDPRRDIALVYATHHYAGGAERYLNQLAAHLAGEGHAVTIVCRRHEEPPHPAVRFERLRVRSPGSNAWRMWAWARAVERHLAARPYDVVVGLGRTWSQDVVRFGGCHQTWLELERRHLLGPWDRWRRKGALKGRVALAIERRALAPGRFRRVLANSALVRDDLVRRYRLPEERSVVIYNGVDATRFHPRLRGGPGLELRRRLGFDDDAVVLLFIGSGWDRKGLRPLLASLARLPERARLLVVGRDKRRGDYEALAGRSGAAGRVRFLEWVREPEACFAAADLHVLPTLYDGFAYTIFEAFATGIPVVTTRGAGASELIEPGLHGEVLAADCGADDLAASLAGWLDDERRARAAPAVRALAEKHSVERCMEATTRLILDVAAERRAGAGRAGAGAAP